jgi:hypothetical protein
MTYLSLPFTATGWKNTLVNDAEGNTLALMPNGHKGLEAVQELTALWAAAPDLLEALEACLPYIPADIARKAAAVIAKAKGE